MCTSKSSILDYFRLYAWDKTKKKECINLGKSVDIMMNCRCCDHFTVKLYICPLFKLLKANGPVVLFWVGSADTGGLHLPTD